MIRYPIAIMVVGDGRIIGNSGFALSPIEGLSVEHSLSGREVAGSLESEISRCSRGV